MAASTWPRQGRGGERLWQRGLTAAPRAATGRHWGLRGWDRVLPRTESVERPGAEAAPSRPRVQGRPGRQRHSRGCGTSRRSLCDTPLHRQHDAVIAATEALPLLPAHLFEECEAAAALDGRQLLVGERVLARPLHARARRADGLRAQHDAPLHRARALLVVQAQCAAARMRAQAWPAATRRGRVHDHGVAVLGRRRRRRAARGVPGELVCGELQQLWRWRWG